MCNGRPSWSDSDAEWPHTTIWVRHHAEEAFESTTRYTIPPIVVKVNAFYARLSERKRICSLTQCIRRRGICSCRVIILSTPEIDRAMMVIFYLVTT